MKFSEEEIVLDVKFMGEANGLKEIVNSGVPLYIVSEK